MADDLGDAQSVEPLISEIERLRIENLLLKQKAELDAEFDKHVKNVEERIGKGQLQLGFAGLVVLCFAWFGTYQELEGRVQKRIDEEFDAKEIKALISRSATSAARDLIRNKVARFTDAEHSQLQCIADRQGRELFLLQCRIDGGQFDDIRGACIEKDGGEKYHERSFPGAECEEALRGSTASAVSRSSGQ